MTQPFRPDVNYPPLGLVKELRRERAWRKRKEAVTTRRGDVGLGWSVSGVQGLFTNRVVANTQHDKY